MENGSCLFCNKIFTGNHLVTCENFKRCVGKRNSFLRIPQFIGRNSAVFEEISAVIKTLFYCEEFRDLVFQNDGKWNLNCKCLFCTIRLIYCKMITAYQLDERVIPMINVDQIDDSVSAYTTDYVIETLCDGFKFIFELLKRLQCSKQLDLDKIFLVILSETLECDCSEKLVLQIYRYSLQIEVNDIKELERKKLLDLYNKQFNMLSSYCKNEKCRIKKSRLSQQFIETPLFLFIDIKWNNSFSEFQGEWLSKNFSLKQLCSDPANTNYELYLIVARNIEKSFIYYYRDNCWFDSEQLYSFDFHNIVFTINSLLSRVELVVYKKVMPDVSPKKQVSRNPKVFNCFTCQRQLSSEFSPCKNCSSSSSTQWVCPKCQEKNIPANRVCSRCKSPNPMSSPLLVSKCSQCSHFITNGQACRNCNPRNMNKLFSSQIVKAVHPELNFCSICKSKLLSPSDPCLECAEKNKNEVLCSMCNKPKSGKFGCSCQFNRKSEAILFENKPDMKNIQLGLPANGSKVASPCAFCKIPSCNSKCKRPASVGNTVQRCIYCTHPLTQSERRNCGNCKKKNSGTRNHCPFCNESSKICDPCLKKIKSK